MKRRYLFFAITCVLLLAVPCPELTAGQETPGTPGTQETSTGPGWDRTEMEAFLDDVMTAHMESYHIAGAVVAVVKDGEVFLCKGYGYADEAQKKPVIADKTLFLTGSAGKLFTWTAVMQLMEQGQIHLDADINRYLKTFKIAATFPEPVTMSHLLSHTPGFEEGITGMYTRRAEELEPLSQYLPRYMPARVRPPGKLTGYSNYGTALAGYIVEVVSGMPFEKYIEENIFKPLEMNHSTFRQPLPAHLAKHMSVGYEYNNGRYEAKDSELVRGMVPAGSSSCTAADMAKFMIAHLGMGVYNGKRILKEDTVKKMHSRLFTHDAKTTGNAHGFWEYRYNNLRIIKHGGGTRCFRTLVALVPDLDMGFFRAYNSPPRRIPLYALFNAFLDRYYPAPHETVSKPPQQDGNNKRLIRFTGSYRATRASFTTFEKIRSFFQVLNVSTTGSGNLLALSKQWVETEPLVFKEAGGQETMVFREDQSGRITHVFFSSMPHFALYKVEGIHKPVFHYILPIVCLLFFLSALGWPLAALARKICPGKNKKEKGREPIWARLVAAVMSGLYILTFLGIVVIINDTEHLFYGSLSFLKVVLALPLFAVLLTVGALIFTYLAWRKKYWSTCQRVHYTLVTLASLVFIWFLDYWNLLGFKI